MKIHNLFILLCILIIVIASAGCTSSQSSGITSYSPKIIPKAELQIQLTNTDSSWSLGQGCYWTASGSIYNSGNAAGQNVQVIVNLVNTNTNSIRDSENIYIGTLQPGASMSFNTNLDGECSKNYKITTSITS